MNHEPGGQALFGGLNASTENATLVRQRGE